MLHYLFWALHGNQFMSEHPASEYPAHQNPAGGSVLVVNPDPHTLVLLSAMLERNGFRALLARNRGEALGIAARSYVPLDVVLCEIGTAGLPGDMLLDRLRELRPEIPAIFVSSGIEDEVIRVRVVRQTEPGHYTWAGDLSLVESVKRALQSRHMSAGVQ